MDNENNGFIDKGAFQEWWIAGQPSYENYATIISNKQEKLLK
jgi:hypothetical protein